LDDWNIKSGQLCPISERKKKMKKRIKELHIRLTEEEYEEVCGHFNASGCRCRADYLLKLVRDEVIYNLPELPRIRAELIRQGNNLNQIAAMLNMLNYDDDNAADCYKQLREVYDKVTYLCRVIEDHAAV